MARNNLGYLESIDSGSNYSFGDKMEKAQAPRSLFDLSHLVTTSIFNSGGVIPISWFETLPNDDIDINIDVLVRVLPQVVPMYSRERLYIYAFWSRYMDLCDTFDVFMRKGYSGNYNEPLPTLNEYNILGDDEVIEAESLGDYLGLPIGSSITSLIGAEINPLVCMMLLRIWRDYFCNKNYFINDRVILPNDDSRFRLGADGRLLSAVDENVNFKFDLLSKTYDGLKFDEGNELYTFGLFSHLYPSDYFLSALPFTQRGTAPSLPLNFSIDWSKVIVDGHGDTQGFVPIGMDFSSGKLGFLGSTIPLDPTESINSASFANNGGRYLTGDSHRLGYRAAASVSDVRDEQVVERTLQDLFSGTSVAGSTIILNDIRQLAITQTELEKMARTDGSYFQFGVTFFGEPSKSARDYRPLYIGGTYKNIAFTEVLQTSGSSVGTTDPSKSSPLGAYAGHGITGITDGRIGHVHCDDYGIVMILACIMPDIYYSQGLEKKFTKIHQDEFFLPERAKLGMIPILNQELFFAGNNGTSEGDDRYLWAYQNPFDELRYIPNRISGKIADPNNKSFFPYTQSRKFTELPNWGRDFAEAKEVRKDSFFAPTETAYTAQFELNIRAVRPVPYKPIPAKIV